MAFLTEEEKKKFASSFFQWEDGKTYHMTVDKRTEVNFSNGKEYLVLITTDQDTGVVAEHKYLFGLINSLDKLGEAYKDENTLLTVTAHWKQGKEKPGKPGEFYDAWYFDVSVYDTVQAEIDRKEVTKADQAF